MILSHKIIIGNNFRLPYIESVVINESKKNFTNTATILIPKKTALRAKKISDYISVGDTVNISLSYSNQYETRNFSGYVTDISVKRNTEIKIEDEAWLYKSSVVDPRVFRDVKLDDLISYYYTGSKIVADAEIGDWVVNKNATFIDILDEIRQKLGLLSYWQDGTLYVGAEIQTSGRTVLFDINRNVPEGSDSIKTVQSRDVGVISAGTSPQNDGSVIERYAFYSGPAQERIEVTSDRPTNGAISQMSIPGITQDRLDELIKRRLPNLYTTKTSGSITTFGSPVVKPGDFARVVNAKEPQTEGEYSINTVKTTFDVNNGYKQTVEVGRKF